MLSWVLQLHCNREFAMDQLDGRERKILRELSTHYPEKSVEEIESLFGIILSNFFADGDYAWVSRLASRINHSKTPNAVMQRPDIIAEHTADGTLGICNVTVAALRKIQKGEEIFMDYGGEYGRFIENAGASK